MSKLIIIGGGMTGLSAAYLAAKAGKKVCILEASNQIGGLLNTFEIGGNQLEHYYHHFFTQDAELHWLLKDLNLLDQIIYKKTTMGVFRNGKIYDFNSPIDLLKFKPVNFFDKIRFGLTSIYLGKIAKWQNNEHIATLQWFYKWAGRGITDALWKPMLDIKFGPYAHKVPLAWMIGRLAQRLNSRKGGDERLGYINGSWKTLLDAIQKALVDMGVEIRTNSAIEEFVITNNKVKGVVSNGDTYEADDFLITIPSIFLDKIKNSPLSERQIEYFGAVCTILELNQSLSGIYWLNVADEGFPFGGVIEHTNFIDKELYKGSHIVYLSRYFAMNENLANLSEDEIKDLMIPHLKRINPAFDESWIKNVFVFKTNTAATVCDLNFSEKVPSCKTSLVNLFQSNMAHIYPDERSTNNSIRVAAEACKLMGINTDFVPNGASLSAQIGF